MNRAGWITIIILCSFISFLVGALIWSFVKPLPNNFDLLTFIEVSLSYDRYSSYHRRIFCSFSVE